MADPWAVQSIEPVADPWAVVSVKPKAKRSVVQDVTGAMAQVNRGLGIGDEMAAGFQTGANLLAGRVPVSQAGEGYRNALAAQRGYEGDFEAARPRAAALARGTGSAATVAVPGAKAVQSTNMLANMARGTVAAAGTGAVYAAADAGTARERVKAASDAALNPLNVVFGAMAGRAGTAPIPRAARPPNEAQLTKQRKAAYKAVETSGHRYSAEDFAGMVGDIKTRLAKEGYDPDFHEPARKMVAKLEGKVANGIAPTLAELDKLRSFARKNVEKVGDGEQRRVGGVIGRGIDKFIDAQGGEASSLVTKARDLYKRELKVQQVNKAVRKAERQTRKSGSGGNSDNNLRSKMDSILEKNAYLTDDERDALESIVMGGPAQNAARSLGKMSPLSGGLSGMINTIAAAGTGGASLALSVPATGAKIAADMTTKAKVRGLIDLMAVGGTKAQLEAAMRRAQTVEGPAGQALRKLIAAKIAQGGGVTQASAIPAR